MKKSILLLLLLLNTCMIYGQNKGSNTFVTWDDFVDKFDKEVASAEEVFRSMVASGLKENSLVKMDFTCISDKKENLVKLEAYIRSHYSYTLKEIKQNKEGWELSAETNDIPITSNNLLYWALDMYKRAYEFDARLQDYGAPFDPQNQKFPDLDDEKSTFYFENGKDLYSKGDLSGSIINLSLAITIDPKNPNAYYSRAIVKNELYAWKSALKDYDKAIEIAPNFIGAIINRGSIKDENGDYQGAIEDYQRVLNRLDLDVKSKQLVLFNLGNTYQNLKNTNKACDFWHQASAIGADYAQDNIKAFCK